MRKSTRLLFAAVLFAGTALSQSSEALLHKAEIYLDIRLDSSGYYANRALASMGDSDANYPMALLLMAASEPHANKVVDSLLLKAETVQAQSSNNLTQGWYHFVRASTLEKSRKFEECKAAYDQACAAFNGAESKQNALRSRLAKAWIIRKDNLSFAKDEYYKILREADAISDSLTHFKALSGLASIHYVMGNHLEAIQLQKQAVKYFERNGWLVPYAASVSDLGTSWIKVNRDSADYYFKRSFQVHQQLQNRSGLRHAYLEYASFLRVQSPEASWYYLMKADSLSAKNKGSGYLMPLRKAQTLETMDKNETALTYALDARRKAKARKIFAVVGQIDALIALCYSKLGNYQAAYQYSESHHSIMDSLRNERHLVELGRLEAQLQFDQELSRQELERQQMNMTHLASQERQWIVIVSMIFIASVLLIFAISLYRNFAKSKRQNKVITEQKEDLSKLNLLNKKIFSVIAHDLQGPMLSMRLLLDSLKKQNLNAAQLEFYTSDVKNQLIQSEIIFQNLMNWGRSELNEITILLTEKTNVQTVVDDVTLQLESSWKPKRIKILNLIPSNIHTQVTADVLSIIYRNLISNAIKYSQKEGTVYCGIDQKSTTFYVRDHGVGIPEEKWNSLFVGATTVTFGTAHEKGFGLGLYITAELITKSEGEIWVDSNETGTTFHFNFIPT